MYFYPRSPCGERLNNINSSVHAADISIHALLAESDKITITVDEGTLISIHALLAESDLIIMLYDTSSLIFLSTLSLRRATSASKLAGMSEVYFYPRSPCGERLRFRPGKILDETISIHALLAESDVCSSSVCTSSTVISIHALLAESDWRRSVKLFRQNYISIHALLAESDFSEINTVRTIKVFLSTLSLRRATPSVLHSFRPLQFLSTLSLRRATSGSVISESRYRHFYPRSPCGERRKIYRFRQRN